MMPIMTIAAKPRFTLKIPEVRIHSSFHFLRGKTNFNQRHSSHQNQVTEEGIFEIKKVPFEKNF